MAVASRYTVAIHALTWIAEMTMNKDDYVPSNQVAVSVGTSPVFIRRILGQLRKAGIVIVKHGGTDTGWRLARNPEAISLLEVYEALEQKPLFELHHSTPSNSCLIAQGIQPALSHLYGQTEDAMKQQLSMYSISDVLKETLAHASEKKS
ncbi:Rrf2 family transcriptional regulator [Paenibacillus sp. J2TS4]|uniref:RrF2 family transcriptional regulator n=1 Tax=Paenibacillus sp. J2TS4 TaxID=2807194 RepID=UPI001B138E70|nr:Rrf2 family transcriptional regulator [Paenibacillus sp. J2TS4]GIP31700.1 transcriptional regulator [Paenibacillus sp. J2TS4]